MRFVLFSLLLAVVPMGVVTLRPGGDVQAGTARRMGVVDMVDAADLVLHGHVVSARASLGHRGLIETAYTLDVRETLWGEPADQRVVRIPGGVLPDGRGLLLAGMPTIRAGEEVLLFLSGESASGVRMPVGLAQGKFTVERLLDGTVRLTRDGAGLELANPATGAVEEAPRHGVFDYAAVLADVRSAAQARSEREAQALEEGR